MYVEQVYIDRSFSLVADEIGEFKDTCDEASNLKSNYNHSFVISWRFWVFFIHMFTTKQKHKHNIIYKNDFTGSFNTSRLWIKNLLVVLFWIIFVVFIVLMLFILLHNS